ncbi:hypothetical protein [Spirosoma radiotolerans]|uniref:Uncharacterized protein n=1 Tax=Spirosoma radiotolerans TaxID=1379870 RepID=A0A0E3ZVC3_9BACT|nr:hypothetical protein [Spirosoma radiotolerans]AKD55043.1 hypothetical protein SD10_09130 [Spirosoma radiotolerans]
MSKQAKLLLWIVSGLLFVAGSLLHSMARAQTYCDTLAHDNVILNRLVNEQDALLAARSETIKTLKVRVSLADSSSEAIRTQANKTIVSLTEQRNTATARADKAEAKVAAVDGKQPKTWAGRQLRKARDGLAVLGAVAAAYITLNIIL